VADPQAGSGGASGPAGPPPKPKAKLAPAVFALVNLTVIVFLVVAAVVVWRHKKKVAESPTPTLVSPPRAETQEEAVMTATLFFARKDGDGLATETREIAVGAENDEGTIRLVIDELARGPRGDGAPVLPAGTRVLRVFRNREGTVFLDLSGEFRRGHWGGAAAEEATVRAITSTVAAGFPDVRAIQILVDGAPVETVAGHVAIGEPIPVRP